jgi:hypothetical protein
VTANLTVNGVTYTVPLALSTGSTYQGAFTNTTAVGSYLLVFIATDTYGNIGTLNLGSFAVIERPSENTGGGGSGGGGAGITSLPNTSGNTSSLNASATHNLSVVPSNATVHEAVIMTGDNDALVWSGIALIGAVMLILGLRKRS